MKIGELARREGAGVDTIRFWEKHGVLPQAQERLSDVEAKIAELKRVQKALKSLVTDCPGHGERARVRFWRHCPASSSRQKRSEADAQMEMPPLTRSNPRRVRSSNVQWIRTKRAHGGWHWIEDQSVRVATVGRLFLDMLQHPEYCGGIRHVIEAFSDYAAQYLPAILAEYETHANNIDKVRAGYILEEHCGVRSDVVASWTRFATRGGGQKLDVSSAYAPVFSER